MHPLPSNHGQSESSRERSHRDGAGRRLVTAPAKINLLLEVGGRAPTGRHELRTVIAPLELADEVSVELVEDGKRSIALSCTLDESLLDHFNAENAEQRAILEELSGPRNLAARAAAEALARLPTISASIRIELKKRVHWQAGLGGGSADAAGVLYALQDLLGKEVLSQQVAEEVSCVLGSDVPAALSRRVVLVEGCGERLSYLQAATPEARLLLEETSLVILKPPVGVSTAEAFRLLGRPAAPFWSSDGDFSAQLGLHFAPRAPSGLTGRKGLTLLGAEGSSGGLKDWTKARQLLAFFANDFESVIYPHFPAVEQARSLLVEAGAVKVLLSGSGSAVLGFVPGRGGAAELLAELRPRLPRSWFCAATQLCGLQGPDESRAER